MIFAGIYKNELSVINVFPSIQCFCLNISEMNRIESTSYSVLITRGISRYYKEYDKTCNVSRHFNKSWGTSQPRLIDSEFGMFNPV